MNGSLRQNVIFHSPASCWQVPALSHPLQLKPSKLTPSTSSAARLSLCALLSHHIYIFFFRFHLLLDLLQWVGGRYGGMPSGEKRQVAFREKNYMQLKESSVYTPDCSSWWSEQKTKRGEPSCCSPAALLILLSSQHLTNEAWFWTYSIIKQEQHFRSNLFRIKATLSPEYVFNMYIFDLWGSEI